MDEEEDQIPEANAEANAGAVPAPAPDPIPVPAPVEAPIAPPAPVVMPVPVVMPAPVAYNGIDWVRAAAQPYIRFNRVAYEQRPVPVPAPNRGWDGWGVAADEIMMQEDRNAFRDIEEIERQEEELVRQREDFRQILRNAAVAPPIQRLDAVDEQEPFLRNDNQPNEEMRLGRMTYAQLLRRSPGLADRYLPDLSNLDNAFNALQSIDADVEATDLEKASLREYVGTHVAAEVRPYHWCADCDSMIVAAEHSHCPHCIYPMIVSEVPVVGMPQPSQVAACGFCGECCRAKGHRYCPTCNVHTERLCRHCQMCTGCCACVLCPRGCQELQECEDCHNCLEHCTCVATTNGPHGKTFPAHKKTERKLFDCNRFAGIEWEYNRLGIQKYMDYWVRKWLGDLHRDDSCGFEAITAPVAGDYMVKCVAALGKVFEKSRAMIDNRCSIHTHVDARDIQWTDMFRFLKLYSIVEPVLYMLAGQERLDNRYAVPIGKEYAAALDRIDRKDAVMAVAFSHITREGRKVDVNLTPDNGRLAQKDKPGKRADNHQYCRRKGLNILPWLAGRGPRPPTPINVPILAGDTLEKLAQRHGVSVAALLRWNKLKLSSKLVTGRNLIINKRTVAPDTTIEFRIHPNTNDPVRVTNWAKIVVRLVDWSVKSTDKDLENLPKSALRILCQVVAPECAPWIMERVKEWRKETSRINGRQARRIAFKGGKYSY